MINEYKSLILFAILGFDPLTTFLIFVNTNLLSPTLILSGEYPQ